MAKKKDNTFGDTFAEALIIAEQSLEKTKQKSSSALERLNQIENIQRQSRDKLDIEVKDEVDEVHTKLEKQIKAKIELEKTNVTEKINSLEIIEIAKKQLLAEEQQRKEEVKTKRRQALKAKQDAKKAEREALKENLSLKNQQTIYVRDNVLIAWEELKKIEEQFGENRTAAGELIRLGIKARIKEIKIANEE